MAFDKAHYFAASERSSLAATIYLHFSEDSVALTSQVPGSMNIMSIWTREKIVIGVEIVDRIATLIVFLIWHSW